MEQLAGIGSLNCLYFACLAAGGVYAAIILLTGAMHDIHMPHVDVSAGGAHIDMSSGDVGGGADMDAGTVKVPSLSPITIASFVTAFGAFGIVSGQLLGASSGTTLLWAAGAGIVVAVIAHFAFGYFLIAPQGSSEVRRSDVIGAQGEVLTPIGVEGLGEVALVARGGRITYSARAITGRAIPRGHAVVVEKLVSNVVWVRPVDVDKSM